MLFKRPRRKARAPRVSGVPGTSGPLAPSHVGSGCNTGAGRVSSPRPNSTRALPSHPGPQETQASRSPEARAPDPKPPKKLSPCTGHSPEEEAAHSGVLLPSWGERRPRRCQGPGGPGFETPSSQECLVTGECPLLCHSTGAAGTTARDLADLSSPWPQRISHPCLQEQSHPLQTTRLQLMSLLCSPLPTPPPPLRTPQAPRPLGRRCLREPGPLPGLGPLARSPPRSPPPQEEAAPSTCPQSQECQAPRAGPVPRWQRDTLTLSSLSLGAGAEASRAGSTGELGAIATGPPRSLPLATRMAGCLC